MQNYLIIYVMIFHYSVSNQPTSGQYAEETGETLLSSDQGKDKIMKMNCGSRLMTLEVEVRHLPYGLEFVLPIEEIGDSGITCLQTSSSNGKFFYAYSLQCAQVIQTNDSTTYTHDALIRIVQDDYYTDEYAQADFPSSVYTITMECKYRDDNRNLLLHGRADLFENRVGSDPCQSSTCAYGNYCIDHDLIDGYKCECLEKGKCSDQDVICPNNYYSCSLIKDNQVTCIKGARFCDGVSDCPSKDDENCASWWSSWEAWSGCSENCETRISTRTRNCSLQHIRHVILSENKCMSDTEERPCTNAYCASVVCTSSSMQLFIPRDGSMESKDILKNIRLNSHNLTDELCLPKMNYTHITYDIPLHMCQTASWSDGDSLFYSNEVMVANHAAVIVRRQLGHIYMGICQYSRENTVAVHPGTRGGKGKMEDFAAFLFEEENSGELMEVKSSGEGQFVFKMTMFEDDMYRVAYHAESYPLKMAMGDRIYAAVDLVSEDEDLTAVLKKCWAFTHKSNDKKRLEYVFIDNGCSVDETTELSSNDPNTDKMNRFTIEAFRFVGDQSPLLYFRCEVVVCDLNENHPDCNKVCDEDNYRRLRRSSNYDETLAVGHVQLGPIVVYDVMAGFNDPIQRNMRTNKKANGYSSNVLAANSSFIMAVLILITVISLLIGGAVGYISKRKITKPQR